jgi:hypothetical protein
VAEQTDQVGICAECGEVSDLAAARIATLEEQLESQREAIGLLERDLRTKRSKIKALEGERTKGMKAHPMYEQAMEVLLHWKMVLSPNARQLEGERLENCLARLSGARNARYTKEELIKAVDGYAMQPYVVNGKRTHQGNQEQWYADAELIFREPRRVDSGIRIWERAQDLQQVMVEEAPAPVPPGEQMTLSPAPPQKVVNLSPEGKAAVKMATHGFHIFPVKPREKVPATRNGLNDATLDLDRIAAFWAKNPHHNVGVRTGAPSGIFVLDVDGEEGWDSLHALENKFGDLPDTLSVTTPRGGEHFYFRHPGWELRNTAGFPGPGLDVRGDGGYVLAPPSVGPGGRSYEVDEQHAIVAAPEWLLGLLRSHATRPSGEHRDWVAEIMAGADQGERDNKMTSFVGWLYSCGHTADQVLTLAVVLNGQIRPPLDHGSLQRIVQSIGRKEARKQ